MSEVRDWESYKDLTFHISVLKLGQQSDTKKRHQGDTLDCPSFTMALIVQIR